jgi:hypothetical protein
MALSMWTASSAVPGKAKLWRCNDVDLAGLTGSGRTVLLYDPCRSAANSFTLRPSPSRVAARPVNRCQRWTITSQQAGPSSTSRARRPVFSAAISVEPDPPKGSSTMSRLLPEFRTARSTRRRVGSAGQPLRPPRPRTPAGCSKRRASWMPESAAPGHRECWPARARRGSFGTPGGPSPRPREG